uniref:Regulator of microtubule dynamics protein 1 n=1 Tax=Microcebus murinus TaxID=30608 RepID=A0A8C5V8Q1_MICMU
MALAARLQRFLPLRRGAAPGSWLPTGTSGSRGQCGPRRFRVSEVIRNPGTFKRAFLHSALTYCLGLKLPTVVFSGLLWVWGETEKLYQLLTQYKESEDAELLWRLARASRDIAQLSKTSEEEKKLLVYEALEYAKRALEKNESNYAAHKIAIELNPKDATSIHLMGIWCYTFAEMPWYQRRIAQVLFATPPSSTYEEVLTLFFSFLCTVDPNFYSKNLLLLGKTYLKLHNKKLAAFWLMKAKDYPPHTEEDKQVNTEAAQLLTGFSDKN